MQVPLERARAIAPSRPIVRRQLLTLQKVACILVLASALLATLIFAFGLLRVRPPMPGEAEVLFEASRVRAHLPLYVDPRIGAVDYSPVPSRFFVLYPPVWDFVVSLFPAPAAMWVARGACTLAWFGLLGILAWSAEPRARAVTLAAAGYVGGIFVLALFTTSGRPDAIALFMAGLALLRSVRRERVDALAGALFAVAMFVKPNIVGMATGALLVQIASAPRAALRGVVGFGGTAGTLAGTLHLVSGGAWLHHLHASLGQPLLPAFGLAQLMARLPFFGAPLALCAWRGWTERSQLGIRLGLGALIASAATTVVSLAHPGSASNYWLEPCVAGLVVLSRVGLPFSLQYSAVFRTAFLAQTLYTGIGSIRGVVDAFDSLPARTALAVQARGECGVDRGGVVIADEPGAELVANGRIVATVFTMNHQVAAGGLPLDTWLADIGRDEVRCVMTSRPGFALFLPEVRERLARRFVLAREGDEWQLYRARATR